ncbi:Crp/Fnr family transcriptional regulator [Phaeobacter porticola]|uniref:cAMP-binding protein n=1 Tax=Phaeobacter porticola TaxID=1844006 RepID=A0A1L3I5H7_9RHOB|nr:Crp/Fnr family transcriptional regulator [Phaeobacter porticola]APG47369.1 cAMP-binding protein [Phaeobacter porticola]
MPTTDCQNCPLRNREIFNAMTAEELTFTQGFKTGELVVDPGTTILLEGSNSPQIYTVLKGMGTRYTTLENGRRQVINFVFPGDFIGLQASLMGEMKHSVDATTSMTLCVFRRSETFRLFEQNPARAYDLTWISAVEEHFLGETIASLGQRDASQRIAWALVRIYLRLRAVGLEVGNTVPLAYRQQDLADALGLSLVHTNKRLKALRDAGLSEWQNGVLTIMDLKALADLALVDIEKPEHRPLI